MVIRLLITRSTNDIVQVQNVMVQFLRMMLHALMAAAIILAYHREPRLREFLPSPCRSSPSWNSATYFAVPLFKYSKEDRPHGFREGLTGCE
ncbi:hypothetical protein ACW185_08770 [Limosilactobacillus fermentum]